MNAIELKISIFRHSL